MKTNRCIKIVLSLGVLGAAFAADLGSQAKLFNTKKLSFALNPLSMDYPFYTAAIEGKKVFVLNESVKNKLLETLSTLEEYAQENSCFFETVSLGTYPAAGTVRLGKDPGNVNIAKVPLADLSKSAELAAKISLPKNWQALCKKEAN